MKRPLLTVLASSIAAVAAALSVLTAAGGISSARSMSVDGRAPAPAPLSARATLPPPAATLEPIASGDNPTELAADDAGAPASAKTPATPAAPLPTLAADPPSDAKTARPARSEWKTAQEIGFTRASNGRCRARRIREWVLVKCDVSGVTGFTLIAGTRDGLDFRMNNGEFSEGSITFELPIRRGDRRVIQVNAAGFKYGVNAELLLSERWSEGDAAPLLTVAAAI